MKKYRNTSKKENALDSKFVYEPANEEISQWRLVEAEGRLRGQIIDLKGRHEELLDKIKLAEEERDSLRRKVSDRDETITMLQDAVRDRDKTIKVLGEEVLGLKDYEAGLNADLDLAFG